MAGPTPREITQRELRNDSGAILRGVERVFVPDAEVLAAFASAPVLDPDRLCRDSMRPSSGTCSTGFNALEITRACAYACQYEQQRPPLWAVPGW